MKRIIVLLLISMLFTTLTACSDTQIDSSQSNEDTSIEQYAILPSPEDVSIVPKILEISAFGDNKIVVSITDEHVQQVIDKNSSSKFIVRFINIGQDVNGVFDLFIENTGWSFITVGIHSNDLHEGASSGQSDTFNLSGNKLSFEINQIGVGKKISEANHYVVAYRSGDTVSEEAIASGSLVDIITVDESNAKIKLTYIDDNDVIIRLSGETIQELLKSNDSGTLWANFHLEGSPIEYQPQFKVQFPYGKDNGREYVQVSILNLLSDTYVDLHGDKNHEAVKTNNGCSGRIYYNDIKTLLSACDRIVITDQNRNVITEESYQKAVALDMYTIPPIPEVFPINDRDKDFFYPVTDDYMVIMIDMPLSTIYDYGYARPDLGEFYMPVEAHESPLKILVVISYDEFGITNQRAKIIYDSVADAMKAPATRLDWLSTNEFTGDEATDNRVRAEFFESIDQNVFGTSHNDDSNYQYFGHFDHVRYFASRTQNLLNFYSSSHALSYDRDSSFDENGFIVETSNYTYEFADFSEGVTLSREDTATITVFLFRNNQINVDRNAPRQLLRKLEIQHLNSKYNQKSCAQRVIKQGKLNNFHSHLS